MRTPLRACVIGVSTVVVMAPALVRASALAIAGDRRGAERLLARRFVELLDRLGPAFIKSGQIVGTRRDVIPPLLCDELAVLADATRPMTEEEVRATLAEVYGSVDPPFEEVDLNPVASGSIACVLRASRPGGDVVAVKLRRPGIERTIAADLAIARTVGKLVARLPQFRGTPVRQIVDEVCATIEMQLDFRREASCLERMRDALTPVPRVYVPRLDRPASREAAIVMEFVPNLDRTTIDGASPAVRRRLAATTMSAVYQMLFVDGLVHCDLHRGNLYYTSLGQVVVLDAGFSVELSDRIRRLFAEFFLNMSLGLGEECARVVIESADGKQADADIEGFTTGMADLVERNFGLSAREFSLIAFATEMFELQRRNGLHAATEIVFPLLSLLVIEGTVRDLDPDIDFQAVARPILTHVVFGAGRPAAQTASEG